MEQQSIESNVASELERAVAAALASQRMLQMVLDSIPQGVFWKDRQSRYLGCNRIVCRAFGLERLEQIVGMDDYQLAGLTREQADFFVRKDQEVMATNTPQLGIIEPASLADGTSIWLETNKIPMHDTAGQVIGVLGTWQDITARKQAEDRLRESRMHLVASQRIARVGSWELDLGVPDDLEANSLRWTDETFRIFGYEPGALMPSNAAFWACVHADDRAKIQDAVARALETQSVYEVDHRVVLPDGRVRFIHERAELVMDAATGKPLKFVGTAQDVTERKQAEDERRRLEAQLLQAQKLESLGVLAGGIAHDFNNLLSSILGYADLALHELPAASPTRHLIGEAVNGALRAAELTNQMLAYSGKGRFVVEPVHLAQVLDDMSRLLQMSISKKCALTYNLVPDLPVVEADATQLRQVVMNLVINASEAMGETGGVIAISTGVRHCDRAYLSETYLDENLPAGAYVYLEVADTGSGMTPETRARIFDPFFTTKFTGRGLGLSVVLGIVRGHGGAVKVLSEPGQGTTFRVLLPASAMPAQAAAQREAGPKEWRGSGTVLVVDDEDMVRDLTRRMLESLGFTVLTAADGEEGVAVFRREDGRICLVLLDMSMPRLDGEETLREMRRIRANVPTILCSGYNEQTATSRFAGIGPSAFIQKPFRYDSLAAVVRRVLEP